MMYLSGSGPRSAGPQTLPVSSGNLYPWAQGDLVKICTLLRFGEDSNCPIGVRWALHYLLGSCAVIWLNDTGNSGERR